MSLPLNYISYNTNHKFRYLYNLHIWMNIKSFFSSAWPFFKFLRNTYVHTSKYLYFVLRKWKLEKYFLFHLPGFSFFPTSFNWIHSFPGSKSNVTGTSLSDMEAVDIWFSNSSCSIWTETSEPRIIRINTQCMTLPAFPSMNKFQDCLKGF